MNPDTMKKILARVRLATLAGVEWTAEIVQPAPCAPEVVCYLAAFDGLAVLVGPDADEDGGIVTIEVAETGECTAFNGPLAAAMLRTIRLRTAAKVRA